MKKEMSVNLKSAMAVALLLSSVQGFAATAVSSMQITAVVVPTCDVKTTPIDFGSVDVSSFKGTPGTGAVTVTCTKNSTYSIAIDKGQSLNASTQSRKMIKNPLQTLDYGLYKDSGNQQAWGTFEDSVGGTGTGTSQVLTVYGLVFGNQAVEAGIYVDTVNVTVKY